VYFPIFGVEILIYDDILLRNYMKKIKVLILRTAGTNCDYETQFAFELCGAIAERIHINLLIENRNKIFDYNILALPGGFSYGDDIASGKILANELKYKLGDKIKKFALNGNPIIGICNGFQVLSKMGLLPNPKILKQSFTLTYNDSGKFECRWVYLKKEKVKNCCIWVRNIPNLISLPVAHSEGKFIPINNKLIDILTKKNQIVFRYSTKNGNVALSYPLSPNGSVGQIAGLCNDNGNVFGLMPHPERYIFALQHPAKAKINNDEYGWGKLIFQNAVDFMK
jgi:phosphoribosylformylglycinamidine synthase